MRSPRRAAAAALSSLVALWAVPAFAAGNHTTTVSVSQAAGTRQMFVEDLAGHDLTAMPFGSGGSYAFRVRVSDSSYTATSENFSVGATLNNLYLVNGGGHDFATRIPSSSVAVGFGPSPLTATGVSVGDLPHFALSGTVPTCATLQTADPSVLGAITTDPTAAPLCALLGVTGQAVAGVSLTGVVQTLSLTVGSVADLPVQLTSGGNAGAFTNANFSSGTIGAGDATGAAGAPAPTSRTLLVGTAGASAALLTQITTALTTALSGLPFTNPTDAGARAALASVLTALEASGSATVAQLGTDIAALGNAAEESAVLNHLTTTLVAPVAGDLVSLTGSYLSFPIMTATPGTPVSGTYEGTLTVTLVQT